MVESSETTKQRKLEEEKSGSTSAITSVADRNAPNNMVQETKDAELVIESSEQLEVIQSFDQLGLNEQLLRGLYAYGFNKPSAV